MTELQKLINIANKEYDGHFTLMKFTTDWGCCFGTLDDTRMTSYKMSHGKTMSEAIKKCIANRTDIHVMNRMEEGKMIHIADGFGNASNLFPGDEIKVIRKRGRESKGIYLGECREYCEFGHWHFTDEEHDPDGYCNYYYPNGNKKYLSIDEGHYGRGLRVSDASASTRIDETSIDRIVVLEHKKVTDTGNV
jgi:hypothetical protein